MSAAQEWLAMSHEEREAFREIVRAERIAQGLSPDPDPARLAATAAIIRRAKAEAS